MTQEQKELLKKDLCARLPYRVVVDYAHNAFDVHKGHYVKCGSKCILNCYLLDVFLSPRQNENGEYIKPFLFPLESMNEVQKNIYSIYINELKQSNGIYFEKALNSLQFWLYANHFDVNNLIPMGLAINAVGLNIY